MIPGWVVVVGLWLGIALMAWAIVHGGTRDND